MLDLLRHCRWLICWLPFGVGAASQPPFWLLEKGDQQIWLLGSIHVGREGFYPLPPAVTQALEQAGQLVMEIDPGSTGDDAVETLRQRALLPRGERLEERLPAQVYQRLQQAATQLNLPLARMQRYHPWFVALLVEQAVYQRHGLQPEDGIDQYFARQAAQRGLPVMGLESFAGQVDLLASLEPYEVAFLQMILGEAEDLQHQLKAIISSWQQGDLAALERLLSPFDDSEEGRAIAALLVYDRNRRWAGQLSRPGPHGKRLVVVGAMHLPGEKGLVRLLQQRGWQPRRLH